MENYPWQQRAKTAKLTQVKLAKLCGKDDFTISRQLREQFGPVPGYLIAIIIAWEGMDAGEREDWIAAVDRELKRSGK